MNSNNPLKGEKNIDFSIFKLNDSVLNQEYRVLKSKLEKDYAKLSDKKYYYINIWNIVCPPCVEEMPLLEGFVDSLNKDIGFIYISAHSDDAVSNFLDHKKIISQKFIYINNMTDFISAIFNELGAKVKSFPMHVIINDEGELLAYLCGAAQSKADLVPIVNFINNLG